MDMVEKYKKDYPDEYSDFNELMAFRRQNMVDKRLGSVNGASEIRKSVSLPDKLMNLLMYVFDGVNEEKLFEPKGEMKWFVKKFPEFLLPSSF